jgi:hypothetical protein
VYVVWKRRRVATATSGRVARMGPGDNTDRPATHCPHQGANRALLVPYLVRARRVGGRPRQENVLILPGVRDCCLGEPEVLARWWLYADDRLDWLSGPEVGSMTAEEAAAMRARLEQTVPRAAPEVVAKVSAEQEARRAREREMAKALAEAFARAFVPRPGG